MTEFCSRDVAFVTPEGGELCLPIPELNCRGVRAIRLDRDRLRRGVISVSADFPERTGRETDARAAGS
jgi:hypothetical protein